MNLYWVVVYPLHTKFPFKTWDEAHRVYELANIYHPYEVTMMYPDQKSSSFWSSAQKLHIKGRL